MNIVQNNGGVSSAGVPPSVLPVVSPAVIEGGTNERYSAILGNITSGVIPVGVHGIGTTRGVEVLRPVTRDPIEVYYELRDNGDVYVESNFSLLNHKIIIY